MAEKTATEASNDFWLEFKAEKQAIEDQLASSKNLPKSKLPTHFNTVLQNINNLEKSLTKATEFIPSYDERQFSLQIKELNDALEQTKAELTPKAKFSFKSRKKKLAVAESPSPLIAPQEPTTSTDADILSEATVLFKDRQDVVLTLQDANNASKNDKSSIDILISNLKNCVVLIREDGVQISAVHIKNVEDCVIYCGKIDGSVLMYGLKNSVLFAGCHQFRMHEAHKVDMMLHVTSRPIIEDSDNIQVCGWNAINTSTNYFDQIEDFNWLKKQASPNWKIMDEDQKHLLYDNVSKLQDINEKEAILSIGKSILPIKPVKT